MSDYDRGYRAAQRRALEAALANDRRADIIMALKIGLAMSIPPEPEGRES